MPLDNGNPSWGSVAATAGLTPMIGAENRKYGWRWINQAYDLIVSRVFGIAQGGTGATTAAQARTNLGVPTTADAHAAAQLTGTAPVAAIPALPASKIASGTLAADRVPALPASKITSGVLAVARIPSADQLGVIGIDGNTNNVHVTWDGGHLNFYVDSTLVGSLP